jgi:hypothetical protein
MSRSKAKTAPKLKRKSVAKPKREKVFIGIDTYLVVISKATSRVEAAEALRRSLGERQRKESANLSLLNRTALVYFSKEQSLHWYRFPGEGPTEIHPARIDAELKSIIPIREPPAKLERSSASEAPRALP